MPEIESITVSCAPKVWLSQYRSFNPHASVTVSLNEGDTPGDALAAGLPVLGGAVLSALKTEIELSNELHGQLDGESTDDLYKFCAEQIGNVSTHPTFSVKENHAKDGDTKDDSAKADAPNPNIVVGYNPNKPKVAAPKLVSPKAKAVVAKSGPVPKLKAPALFSKGAAIETE